MPQTSSSSNMFTPCGFSPHVHSSKEDQGGLTFQDGNLISASLDALIQHLIPTVDYYPEKAYVFTFLLSSRLFIQPHELVSQVCHRCIEQLQPDDSAIDEAHIRKFGPKILQLLTEWTETFPSDFLDERMVGHLTDMIHRMAPCEEVCWERLRQLLQTLNQKLALPNQGEQSSVKVNGAISDQMVAFKSKPQSIQRDILSVCSDSYTLAQQLTHVELERLSHIGPEEFVQAFVHKDLLESTKPCFTDQKKTSNLEAYVKWFNRLCYLVATEICMPAKKKQRAQVIEFFIDVARECFNIGNFNSLMAIISGMNMSPVSRLKKTWSKVKTAKFFILEHQMDPTGNFYNYRTALRGAVHRSLTAHSNREKIVIPFFSLLIKDIYFLNEGCANRLPNGFVNFEKFLELAKQVGEFMTWKQVECPFEQDHDIIHYLHTAPIFTEDGLYLASYESESPENQTEKDRWKSLRSTILGKT
uniref:Ras-GEF domain-containing family member 1C n=1 Tax=Geotrypetes seraphini TaxID=260995 RepID=A0A6P8Q9A7_GEOSA|nr:ras-GEF domain-containing family member 1C [Geotrypetes seraphini]XP_033783485.1 ras-GEF domain-containing family member 1C [Geotrypetes seraphini]XP_033783486.1 ras-GEF domain-containing family member 1C [Geotrypetes seraphini]